MITRDNLKAIISEGFKGVDRVKFFDELDTWYIEISASFSNGGASVTLKPMNDLPDDYDELVASGNVCFLDSNDPIWDIYNPSAL